MLAKRIIPCLDIKDNVVVKGTKFKNHVVLGEILDLAQYYSDQGADELVFYDITASIERRIVSPDWIEKVSQKINIPFSVAGGIRTVEDAKKVLYAGADKISINTPAIENPSLINDIANVFGKQCVVIGIDSRLFEGEYCIFKNTGSEKHITPVKVSTLEWVKQVQQLGAGEIVLNCMNSDGMKSGYDINQLQVVRNICKVPLIASGGAGTMEHFTQAFQLANVDGALAASVFHKKEIEIPKLKKYLQSLNIPMRT